MRGKLTDMDVHLVHKSVDGKLLVIAIRFAMDRGNPNAVMAMLWPHLPKTTGATEKVADIVNPGGFLPADRGYWTYTGSLSAPPCTEGVRWIIYENDLTLSLEQLRTFMIPVPYELASAARPPRSTHRSQRIGYSARGLNVSTIPCSAGRLRTVTPVTSGIR